MKKFPANRSGAAQMVIVILLLVGLIVGLKVVKDIQNINPLARNRISSPTIVVQEVDDPSSYNKESVAQEFYATHPDDYDLLVIFNDFGHNIISGGAVKNEVTGIGIRPGFTTETYDLTATYGSSGRLKGASNLGYVKPYYSDPTFENVFVYNAMLHEMIAHLWGLYVGGVQDSNHPLPIQNTNTPGHWTPCISIPRDDVTQPYWGAHLWNDNGDGTWTKQLTDFNKIHKIDPFMLYLMGLIPPENVPITAKLINPNVDNKSSHCGQNSTVTGTATDITVWDIINSNGLRNPLSSPSPVNYSIAYILLIESGAPVDPVDLEKIQNWATNWPEILANSISTLVSPTPTPIIPSPYPTTPNTFPTITTSRVPNGVVGEKYTTKITGKDPNIGDTLTMSAYSLPPGINSLSDCTQKNILNEKVITCTLTGVPSQVGNYEFYVAISDYQGGTEKTFNVTFK